MTRLARMQVAVARLLTEPSFRLALYDAGPEDAPSLGLAPEELATLRRIDVRSLGIASEGYAGKRFERIATRYPLTLQAFSASSRGARWRYLQETSFARSEADECAAFAAYARAGAGLDDDGARLLRDLLSLEERWPPGTTRPLAAFRDGARVVAEPGVLPLALEGPADEALAAFAAGDTPRAYPAAPALWLVLGPREVERLDDEVRALWRRCVDGPPPAFDEAPALRRWLRAGLLRATDP